MLKVMFKSLLIISAYAIMQAGPSGCRIVLQLDPLDVRFTQEECSRKFQNGTRLVDLYWKIVFGTASVESVPHIRVVRWRDLNWSIDNRRLAVWRMLALTNFV